MTEQELRELVVSTANSYLGVKEYSEKHKEIINTYNSQPVLPRSYRMKLSDAWCATFVSFVSIKCGLTSIMPTECGCPSMIKLYMGLGRWVENDAYVPTPGDVVMYDWDDNGKGDNVGNPDHVGIVTEVYNGKFKVIEGNCNNDVGTRIMDVDGRYIRGFGVPNYGGVDIVIPAAPVDSKTYIVSSGDTLWGIALKLLGDGDRYREIAAYNGLVNPDRLEIGQVIRIPGSEKRTTITFTADVTKIDAIKEAIKSLDDSVIFS